MPSEIIGIFDNCEENKSNNFFVGKQKIKLVNYTFCFTNFISHGTKILKIIVNNGQKSLKGLKASRKNKFIINFENIAKKIIWHYNNAYISCKITKMIILHRSFGLKLYKESNLLKII